MGGCVTACSTSCTTSCQELNPCCCVSRISPLEAGLARSGSRGKSLKTFGLLSLAVIRMRKSQLKNPLNERDIFTMMRSWKHVRREIAESGANMFLRMFESKPTVTAAFQKFRSIDTGSGNLRESTTLRTHGLVVMSAIDEIVSNLDDEECVVEMAIEQGRTHAKFDDLPDGLLWEIETPFIDAARDTLGPQHFRPHIEKLYRATIRYILTLLTLGFHEARAEMAEKAAAKTDIIDNGTTAA